MEIPMIEVVDLAIRNVLGRIRANVSHDEALKYSQGVVNLAHAWEVLTNLAHKQGEIVEDAKPPKRGPGRPRKEETETD